MATNNTETPRIQRKPLFTIRDPKGNVVDVVRDEEYAKSRAALVPGSTYEPISK